MPLGGYIVDPPRLMAEEACGIGTPSHRHVPISNQVPTEPDLEFQTLLRWSGRAQGSSKITAGARLASGPGAWRTSRLARRRCLPSGGRRASTASEDHDALGVEPNPGLADLH